MWSRRDALGVNGLDTGIEIEIAGNVVTVDPLHEVVCSDYARIGFVGTSICSLRPAMDLFLMHLDRGRFACIP